MRGTSGNYPPSFCIYNIEKSLGVVAFSCCEENDSDQIMKELIIYQFICLRKHNFVSTDIVVPVY